MESGQESGETQLPVVPVIDAQVMGFSSEASIKSLFDTYKATKPAALILVTNSTGATSEIFDKHIKESVDEGTPVFLIPRDRDNERRGIEKLPYESNLGPLKAGATPLEKVNYHATLELVTAIQTASSKGLSGEQLKSEVVKKYGTPKPPTQVKK